MRCPTIYKVNDLAEQLNHGNCYALVDGDYVPARPIGFDSFRNRIKAAWMVFLGKADAIVWIGQ